MKTLQDVMIEKYPVNSPPINPHNTLSIQDDKKQNKEEIKEEYKDINENNIQTIKSDKYKNKLIITYSGTITILFLFYPYINSIIKKYIKNVSEQNFKMILISIYLFIFILISKLIFSLI